MNGQTDLFQIVTALHPSRRFSRRLDRWQQQADHHTVDRYYY
jgi:hypothetical protein